MPCSMAQAAQGQQTSILEPCDALSAAPTLAMGQLEALCDASLADMQVKSSLTLPATYCLPSKEVFVPRQVVELFVPSLPESAIGAHALLQQGRVLLVTGSLFSRSAKSSLHLQLATQASGQHQLHGQTKRCQPSRPLWHCLRTSWPAYVPCHQRHLFTFRWPSGPECAQSQRKL